MKASILGGALVITGTMIGAGMFALPTTMSGVWYFNSIAILAATWLCMMTSGLMILEASTHYPVGTSFPTMVKDLLGTSGNFINGLSLAFVLYLLTYAYITSGGGLTQNYLNTIYNYINGLSSGSPIPYWAGQVIFFIIFAGSVLISTHWVTRFNAVLIGGMVITFLIACTGLLSTVKTDVLANTTQTHVNYWSYAWPALPVALASFGFHGNVPSLRKYFEGDSRKTIIAIVLGTLFALVIYVLWQTAVQGNLPRKAFAPVIAKDGQLSVLVNALSSYSNTNHAIGALTLFMYFAIATSFLGVTLGLFDFIADLFHWNGSLFGRAKTAIVTFLPPFLLSLKYPDGFVTPIGYAGLMATIWVGFVPAIMLLVAHKRYPTTPRVRTGNLAIFIILAFSVINVLAFLLVKFGFAPVFTG